MAIRHVVIALALAGCRDQVGPRPNPDLSVVVADMAVPDDLAAGRARDLSTIIGGDVDAGPAGVTSLTPGASDRFLIQGTLLTPTGPLDGELLVEGTMITCVAASCDSMSGAAGATIVRTGGIVIPGLIDAHNHGLFDIFDAGDWTPTKLYGDHNQWTAEPRYMQMINAKQYLDGETTGSTIDVGCEMDKYAEVKALVAGTTSIVIAPGTARTCYASLARTIDTPENDLSTDAIQTSISVPATADATAVCANFSSGKTNAYVVHVAEGVDAAALKEFSTLAGRSSGCLLSNKTTIVHGTALTATEFAQMATAGMRLVWSPQSNVFLYGATTRIDLALAANVPVIALAPDWSLGGSVNMLDELRFAQSINHAQFNDAITPQRLFQMATIDAAKALGVDAQLGSLEVGKRADLALLGVDPSDPYVGMQRVRPRSVQMVMVDGRALYGDAQLSAAGPTAPGCEPLDVCGVPKFLCAAESSSANELNETFAQITTAIDSALTTYDAMVAPMSIAPFSPRAQLTNCD